MEFYIWEAAGGFSLTRFDAVDLTRRIEMAESSLLNACSCPVSPVIQLLPHRARIRWQMYFYLMDSEASESIRIRIQNRLEIMQ